MRGRSNRTTRKLKRKVAAASGLVSSGNRSTGKMAHNMDKCHNLSVPCSSAVRDILCDIFPELNTKSSYNQSLLGQIIRKYLLEEKDKRLRVANDPLQSKKKRKRKKKKTTEPVTDQSFIKSPQSSTIINNNEKHQSNFPVIHEHKLDHFIEKLATLNKIGSDETNQHCVQIKSPPESRDLPALLEFIRCRYQEFNKSDRPIPRGRPVLDVSEIPTIPLQKLHELCERIQCQSCRNDTLSSLAEITSGQSSGTDLDVELGNSPLGKIEDKDFLNTFILNASYVVIPNATKSSLAVPVTNSNYDGDGNANDADRAELGFPVKRETEIYGKAVPHDDGPQLNFVLARYEDSSEKFVQLRPLGGPDQTHSFPFSTLDVDGIIRHIIIPCGLVELEQQNEQKISPENITSMKREASKMIETFSDKMNGLTKQIEVIQNLLNEASEASGNCVPFAPLITKKLRECDSECEIYMESYMEFLIILHHSTSAARLEQRWLNKIDEHLWDEYEKTVQSLIEPSLNHRWKVINLQEKCPNALPPTYNSTVQRKYIHDMIDEKLNILSALNEKLVQVLGPSSSDEGFVGDLTTLKRIVAYAVYFSHKHIEKKCLDTRGCVHEYKTLLILRSASVCKTIHETKILDILDIQSKRTDNMRNQTNLLSQNMAAHSEAIIGQLPQNYALEWKANNIEIEDRTAVADEIYKKRGKSEASLESEKNELRNSCYLVGHVAKQCRLLEDLKDEYLYRDDNSIIKKLITPGYSKNLDDGQIILTVFANEERHGKIPEKCDGGGGERRVISIISVCIYGWLQDRCMEWHADLTQKELLSAVEDEPLRIHGSIPRTKKISKKKKDRRKTDVKKLPCVNVEADTEPSEKVNIDSKQYTSSALGSDANGHTDDSLLVVRDTSYNINEGEGLFEDEKIMPSNMIDSKKRNITEKEIASQKCSGSHYFKNLLGQNSISLLQTTKMEVEGETHVSVGVVYGTNFISAKDYLINRYLLLHSTAEINYIQL